MSTRVSSGTSLTSTYYMRNFYSNNRSLIKSSGRKECSASQLSYEDSLALHRAAKRLKTYDFSSSDNTGNLYGTVKAFADTYNNTVSSSAKSSSSAMNRYSRQLKHLVKKYSEQFSDIGITMNNDGTLKVSEDILKNADSDDLENAFGKDAGFTSSLYGLSRRMGNTSYDDYFTSLSKGSSFDSRA